MLTIVSIIINVICVVVLMKFCIPAMIWGSSTPGHCMSLMTQLVIGLLQACKVVYSCIHKGSLLVSINWLIIPLRIWP